MATSARTGEPSRSTTYRGLVWLQQPKHQIPPHLVVSMGSTVVFVLADSLVYEPGVVTVAVEAVPLASGSSTGLVLACAGRLVTCADGLARVEVTVSVFGQLSGLSYNVGVEAPAGAVR